mgnify:FL=1
MTEILNFQDYPCTETHIKEQKSNRLERIAVEIIYNEYQRGMKKNNGAKPENYVRALDFLDLQVNFTEGNFNNILQKALGILYGID